MQELKPEELVELASILVTLMIFYSIDAKFRFSRKRSQAKLIFRVTSLTGGLSVAIAFCVVWVEMFLPEESTLIPVLAYFIPASLAVLCALMLATEVVVLRIRGEEDGDADDDEAGSESA